MPLLFEVLVYHLSPPESFSAPIVLAIIKFLLNYLPTNLLTDFNEISFRLNSNTSTDFKYI